MTSIGCLFLGSPAAVRRGRQIFKRLNKAILASVSKTFPNDALTNTLSVGQRYYAAE